MGRPNACSAGLFGRTRSGINLAAKGTGYHHFGTGVAWDVAFGGYAAA